MTLRSMRPMKPASGHPASRLSFSSVRVLGVRREGIGQPEMSLQRKVEM